MSPKSPITPRVDDAAAPTPTPAEGVGPRRWPRRLRRSALAVLAVGLALVLCAAVALRLEDAGDPAAAGRTRGRDAVWLGHAWVDGRQSAAATAALVTRLRRTGIRDLYVHTGPLADDGTLDPALYRGAAAFLRTVHSALPRVRVQAWLGDVVAHGGPPGLRLGDPGTRRRVRDSAARVLAAGFDGVHLDLEPVTSGDGGYLALLESVHAMTAAAGRPLSAATPQIDPLPALHSVAGALFDHPKWWSQEYFGQVARRVDQVAVMAYDTGLPLRSLFGGYVAQQTALALRVTPRGTDLVIGLPAYHTDNLGHHASAETVAQAVRGARLALGRQDPGRRRFGLGLYVDFAATEQDWAAYRAGWGAV